MGESRASQIHTCEIHTLLDEIDAAWERTHHMSHDHDEIRRGPFSAFKTVPSSTEYADSPDITSFIENFLDKAGSETLFDPSNNCSAVAPTTHQSPWLSDLEEKDLAYFLQMQNEILTGTTLTERHASPQNITMVRDTGVSVLSSEHSAVKYRARHNTPPIRTIAISSGLDIVRESPVLLKYYADTVIPLLTPFKHGKTPWHVLFLPFAKTTFAGITIGDSQDDASLAAFYAILSLSAFHLHAASQKQKWYDQASFYNQIAQQHMSQVQKQMYELPKMAKYKDIVMALLAMAQLSVSLARILSTNTLPNSAIFWTDC